MSWLRIEGVIASETSRLAAVVVVCVPLVARADSPPDPERLAVSLDYAVETSCPEAGDFKAVVTRRLGYDPFRDSARDHVLVRITSRGHGLEGQLEWRDAAGHWAGDRTFPLRSDNCEELVRVIGFALAVQIQILAAGTPPEQDDAPAAAPAATARPPEKLQEPAAVTSAAAPPDRRPPATFAIGAGPSIGFGLSPDPTPIGRVYGSVAWPHVSLELAGEVSLPATTRRTDGAGFSQQALLASAAACGAYDRFSVCLLGKAGQIRVAGQDLEFPASPSGSTVQAGLRAALRQPLGRRAYLAAHADGLVILRRWTITLDDTPVWTAPRFAATFGIDLGVHFQ